MTTEGGNLCVIDKLFRHKWTWAAANCGHFSHSITMVPFIVKVCKFFKNILNYSLPINIYYQFNYKNVISCKLPV